MIIQNEGRRLRIDILVIHLTTLILILSVPVIWHKQLTDLPSLWILTGISGTGIAGELFFLKQNTGRSAKIKGTAAAMITSIVIILTVICRAWLAPLLSEQLKIPVPLIIASAVIFISGLTVRTLARLTLGSQFSYALQADARSKLITHGIYSSIRHPAYLGTLLFIFSLTLISGIIFMPLVIIPAILYTSHRITQEESILSRQFPEQYREYCRKTGKLLPLLPLNRRKSSDG